MFHRLIVLVLSVALASAASKFKQFIQLTDIHYDKSYLAESKALYFCHRDHGSAGPFGTRNDKCGSSLKLVNEALLWTRTQLPDVLEEGNEFKFLLWSGDSVRKDLDEQIPLTAQEVETTLSDVTKIVSRLFHPKISVLPAIGASDLFPTGKVEQSDNSLQILTAVWAEFLQPIFAQNPENQQTFMKWGTYHVDTVNGSPLGFTVMVLNPEFWSKENPSARECDNPLNPPGAQIFDWAEGVLNASAAKGHQVLIVGHRPPNSQDGHDSYLDSCLRRYKDMTATYQHSIMGHVYGSSEHQDTFDLLTQDDTVVGVVNSAPSLVADHNPAIRVYHYDPQTAALDDYVQYYVDIEQANEQNAVAFTQEYRARDVYKMPDLSPASWEAVYESSEFSKLYEDFRFVRAAPAVPRSAWVGYFFTSVCGAIVVVASILAVWKCRQFKHKTYERELAEGLI